MTLGLFLTSTLTPSHLLLVPAQGTNDEQLSLLSKYATFRFVRLPTLPLPNTRPFQSSAVSKTNWASLLIWYPLLFPPPLPFSPFSFPPSAYRFTPYFLFCPNPSFAPSPTPPQHSSAARQPTRSRNPTLRFLTIHSH